MFIMSGNRCRYCSSATSGRFLLRIGSIHTLCNPIFFNPILQFNVVLFIFPEHFKVIKSHYCLVSLMWMKIGSNDITAQVPGVS
jgi:hypothetical protein